MDISHKKLNLRLVPVELVFRLTLLEVKALADAIPMDPDICGQLRAALHKILSDNSLVLSDITLSEKIAENEQIRANLEARQAELSARDFSLVESEAQLAVKDNELKERIAGTVEKESELLTRESAVSVKEAELSDREAAVIAKEAELDVREQQLNKPEPEPGPVVIEG